MFPWLAKNRPGPIGVDLGQRAIKLVQLRGGEKVEGAIRWDITSPGQAPPAESDRETLTIQAIRKALESHRFRGREAVLCLTNRELFLQNIRVPKAEGPELARSVYQEVAGRIPYPIAEADLRFLEAADIRQGDALMREVIVMACHRPVLLRKLKMVEEAGLMPIGVDVEPCAVLRNYRRQQRREEDREARAIYVRLGYSRTVVVIAEGNEVMFVKYLDIGGLQFDQAVAHFLGMPLEQGKTLRRHNGDRRADQQDPEVAQSVQEAIRPELEKLMQELALCIRYHSVAFRGKPLMRFVLGGSEATQSLLEAFCEKFRLKGELSEPFRGLENSPSGNRTAEWDVAAGLAFWERTPA